MKDKGGLLNLTGMDSHPTLSQTYWAALDKGLTLSGLQFPPL